MHSHGFAFNDELPVVYVNPKTAERFAVQEDAYVAVISGTGKLKTKLCVDDDICDNIAFIYQGFWHKSGAVNYLTTSVISDMGKQAAYYDSFCTIEKIQ
jgi:anaerobic selenocysteine-containing dehydrogenase